MKKSKPIAGDDPTSDNPPPRPPPPAPAPPPTMAEKLVSNSGGGTNISNAAPASGATIPSTQGRQAGTVSSGDPQQRYMDDLQHARDVSAELLQGHQSARISDPRQAQIDEYLAMLKKRLGGMDSGEELAMREQGLLNLDQQTAQSLERYAGIAGSRGVQGGANAALVGRALFEANQNRAILERQFVLDNLARKDAAMQAYGGALTQQQGVSLGIEQQHADAADRDTGLALSLPFDIMGGIGTYRGQDSTERSAERAYDISYGQLVLAREQAARDEEDIRADERRKKPKPDPDTIT